MARLWFFFMFAVLLFAGPSCALAQTATTVEFATLSPSATQVPGKFCYSNGQDLVCDGTIPTNAGLGVSDSIVSGSHVVRVNQDTGNVSLTTADVDWGYLRPSGYSYLPYLNTAGVSSTGAVSATYGYIESPSPFSKFKVYNSSDDAGASSSIELGQLYGASAVLNALPSPTTVTPGYGRPSGFAIWTNTAAAGGITLSARSPSGSIYFYTGGGSIESMRLDNFGNLGIGVTSATAKLDVKGTISATSVIAAAVQQCSTAADVGKMYRHANGKWATCTLR